MPGLMLGRGCIEGTAGIGVGAGGIVLMIGFGLGGVELAEAICAGPVLVACSAEPEAFSGGNVCAR